MSERAEHWGVLPSYWSYQGQLIETSNETEEAILAAMGASGEQPSRGRRYKVPAGPCVTGPDRAWGWAVQLYALRSRESWGIGDMADLRQLGQWSRTQGASLVLLNPLGAQTPIQPYQASPYYASSRRFRNTMYIRIEEVEGAERCATELEPLRAAAQKLNDARLIDYDEVFRLKSQALEAIFRVLPDPRGLAAWARGKGQPLRDFAIYNALAEAHGPAWRSWPQALRHPRGAGLEAERQRLFKRVAFHVWQQFHLDRQMARVADEIGLITDVPVGFASDSFDAWRWQDLLAPDMRVGAPPDEFFPDGQDWGFPPFDPWKLRRAHYEPFVEAVRSAAAHAAGIRLDHVMSLFRLFWIPSGSQPGGGAYVRYPATDLLGLLAAESRRARAFVIGEDLGLVEPEVRTRLRRRGALSYRLLWFEGPTPDQWPKNAVAAVGTHDLPTVAGIWDFTEPDQRQHRLRQRLLDVTHAPDGTSAIDVAVSAYAALAASPSRIVLASLEDALGVSERPNVPGTTTEFPNWRLALPAALEEVENADGVLRIVDAMKTARRSRS
ncbi:MAG TPA: 4-alpha-glucanotransferase [Clostridia bacterium]|nr:4-alpha-glucanotransferase [Clostridia bacterium]